MITRAVAFPSPSATLDGYLALPDGAGPHPGVVVIHEAYGLNARHSFFNDQGRAYNQPAAVDSWARTLEFFAQHVRASGAPA